MSIERTTIANLELLGRLLQQFTVVHETRAVNVLVSADYLAIRSATLTALAPYPEAKLAVGRALHGLEVQAAEEIAPKGIEQQAQRERAMSQQFSTREERTYTVPAQDRTYVVPAQDRNYTVKPSDDRQYTVEAA